MLTRIRKAMKERDQGFTLIELLVVIIIIGILAAIAIPVFLNQRKKGVDASLKQDLRSMAIAEETFVTSNPTTGGVAVAYGTTGGAAYSVNAVSPVTDFQASPGNFLTVVLKGGGYCVSSYNAGASTAVSTTAVLQYDSIAGGLGKVGGAC